MTLGRRQTSAFTLLELIVVVTIITMAIGWTTLDLHGLSDRASMHTAATQIGAIQRTVTLAASTSGMPRKIVWDRRSCTVFRPVFREGQWQWSSTLHFDLVKHVWLRGVSLQRRSAAENRTAPPWSMTVRPASLHTGSSYDLVTQRGLHGTVMVDGFTGAESLRLEDTER